MLLERLQTRMDALATLLELRFATPDAPARSVRAFASRCAAPPSGVTTEELWAEAERVAEHLPSFLSCCIDTLLARATLSPVAALRLARAMWKLLDREEYTVARIELAVIGHDLARHIEDGQLVEARAAIAELAAWRATYFWVLFYAMRYVADPGDRHPARPTDGVRPQG